LEGDPDQPIITGRTYHAVNQPPYKLPEHKTKMVIRSDTHKQGAGAQKFNELSFEDENGREKIYLHAEKDEEIHIKNDSAKRVDRNRTESVGNSFYQEIAKNNYEFIGGDYHLNIGSIDAEMRASIPHRSLDDNLLNVARSMDLEESQELGEKGSFVVTVSRDFNTFVAGIMSVRTGGTVNFSSGTDYSIFSGGNKFERVQQSSFESIRKGKYIHSKEIFEVRCGQSSFTMRRDGTIEIIGIDVKVRANKIDLN